MADKKPKLKELFGATIKELRAQEAGIVEAHHMGDEFLQLLADRREASNAIAELEESKEQLSMEIATRLIRHGYLGCTSAYGNAAIIASGRSTIDKTKLVEHGVSTETIDACTTRSESESLRVTEGQ